MKVDVWHCPKCSKQLDACGEVDAEGEVCPVFQCEECTEEKEVLGEMFEMSVTFAVKRGVAVDIVTGERI